MSSNSSDNSDYGDSEDFEIPEHGSFTIVPSSIPINFALFMHPDKMDGVHINESCLATVTSRKTTQLVKVIPSKDCSPDTVQIPKLLQRTLDASIGDKVAITGYDTKAKADAIQVVPLFDTQGVDYTSELKRYFAIESHPISIGATFSIAIGNSIHIFRIVNIIQIDRCCTTDQTRIVLINPHDVQPPTMIVLSRHFCDLALPSEIITHINKYIFLPLQHQRLLRSLGVRSSIGVMFYGSQGTGKTSLLIAISREAHVPSLTIKAPELFTVPLEQAYGKLQQGFKYVLNHTPAMLIIDDIGNLAGKTDSTTPSNVRRLRSYFVSLLDRSMEIPGFVIVATANNKNEVDPTLLRYGRFGFESTLEMPPATQRAEILKLNTQGLNIDPDILVKLAGKPLDNFSCAKVENVAEIGISNMIMQAIRTQHDFPTDAQIIQACSGELRPEFFPVSIDGAGSSPGSGNGMVSPPGSGPFGQGSGSGIPKIDDNDYLFGSLAASAMNNAPSTTSGMPNLDSSLFLGSPDNKPGSTGGVPDVAKGMNDTDMFGRPIQNKQENNDVDMFGRSKTGSGGGYPQPPANDDVFSGFGNQNMGNPFGGPDNSANPNSNPIISPQSSQEAIFSQDTNQPPQNQQNDPFATFGASNQPSNLFGEDSQPPLQPQNSNPISSSPPPPSSSQQQNGPFSGFGSQLNQSPFGGDGQAPPPIDNQKPLSSSPSPPPVTPQQPPQQQKNDPFANFGSSTTSPNPFAEPPSFGGGFGGAGNTQPTGSDPFTGGFGGAQSNQPQNDPFANFGSTNQPSNMFSTQQAGSQPATPPFPNNSQQPNQPPNQFGDPFSNMGGNQMQPGSSDGFPNPPQIPGQSPLPPQAGSQPITPNDPFGDFRNNGQPTGPQQQDQPDPFKDFRNNGPQQTGSLPMNPPPQPGAPQDPFNQQQNPNPFSDFGNNGQAQQTGSLPNQSFEGFQNNQQQPPGSQPNQPQDPFNQQQNANPFNNSTQPNPFNQQGNMQQPPNGFGNNAMPNDQSQQQQNPFGGPNNGPQQTPFGGPPQQQPNDPFGGTQQQPNASPFGGPPQQQPNDPFGAPGNAGQPPNQFGGPNNGPQQTPFGGPPQQQPNNDPFATYGGGPSQQGPNSFGQPNQPQDPFATYGGQGQPNNFGGFNGGPPQGPPGQFGNFNNQQPADPFGGGFGGNQQPGGFGGNQQPAGFGMPPPQFQPPPRQSTNIVLGGGGIRDMFAASDEPQQEPQPQQEQPPQEVPIVPMIVPNVPGANNSKPPEVIDIFGERPKSTAPPPLDSLSSQANSQPNFGMNNNMGGPGMGGPGMNSMGGPGMNNMGGPGMNGMGGPGMNGMGGIGMNNMGGPGMNNMGGPGMNGMGGPGMNNMGGPGMNGMGGPGMNGMGGPGMYGGMDTFGNNNYGMGGPGGFGGMGAPGNFGGMGAPGGFGGMGGPGGFGGPGMNNSMSPMTMGGPPPQEEKKKDDPFSHFDPLK